jgi:dephospho-CoA kinase
MVKTLAITGGTGSGKSFVARNAAESLRASGRKVTLLDADQLARELRDTNVEAKQRIKSVLGDEVYDANDVSIPSKISTLLWNPANAALRQRYEAIFNGEAHAQPCEHTCARADRQKWFHKELKNASRMLSVMRSSCLISSCCSHTLPL